MCERPLRILQVSTADVAGGAEKVACDLFHTYRARGHDTWLAVGRKITDDPRVLLIPGGDTRSGRTTAWASVRSRLRPVARRMPAASSVSQLLRAVAKPHGVENMRRGVEDFDFPGTWRLLEMAGQMPDIVHCHNLHGSYFDLRALPWLSSRVPVVATLHDAWLLSGHCALSFDCDRWKIGCGHCPDLTIYPAVKRDATAYNWERKRSIYADSKLYVATASRWLMDRVSESMLAPSVAGARIIPNGVDVSVFHPADRHLARQQLGMPQQGAVLLFTAHGVRRNIWKDYHTMQAAVALVRSDLEGQNVLFVAVGEDVPAARTGEGGIRFVPYEDDPSMVATYYCAADIYLHAAKAETWGLTITEALACGTPVVATAVGGIPEQLKGLATSDPGPRLIDLNRHNRGEATGMLVPEGDARCMAASIVQLVRDESLRRQLGANAARDARDRFDLRLQADQYLDWYQQIIDNRHTRQSLGQHAALVGGFDALPDAE
jgi:glycosyltransferase involved in cell wall biosynthesis